MRNVGETGESPDESEALLRASRRALALADTRALADAVDEALARLAASAGRELSNLGTVAAGYAERVAARLEEDHPAHGDLRALGRAAERAAADGARLLAFASPAAPPVVPLELDELLRDLVEPLRRAVHASGAAAAPAGAAAPVAPVGRAAPAPTILLADDEAAVRSLVARILAEEGYCVLEAEDGAHALDLLTGPEGAAVVLVVSDIVMPRMGGRELAGGIARLRPGLPVLLVSGYDDHAGQLPEGVAFLAKPFSPRELRVLVAALLPRGAV